MNTENTVNKCGWLPNNEMLYCFTGTEKQLLWNRNDGDFEPCAKSEFLNAEYQFLLSCTENDQNEVLTLSLSENLKQLFVDGKSSHKHFNTKEDYFNGADFITTNHFVGYSDKNVYLCF